MCTYKENSNEPCETCLRRMTALHMCEVLQEIQKEQNNEDYYNDDYPWWNGEI